MQKGTCRMPKKQKKFLSILFLSALMMVFASCGKAANSPIVAIVNESEYEEVVAKDVAYLYFGFDDCPYCKEFRPNNPTGAVMSKEDLEAIAEVIIANDLFVITDEIYSELSYNGDHVSIASLPGMKERTVYINGFSKGFAMTGWRLGYATAPPVIMEQMIKIHQFAIMAAPTTSQYAGIVALRSCDDNVAEMRESYNQRRRYLMKVLKDLGLPCFVPYGAFYIFPNITEFGLTSEEFATRLVQEEKVAVVPGSAFGESGEGFIRISYAYSIEELKEAFEHIKSFIERLRAEKKSNQ